MTPDQKRQHGTSEAQVSDISSTNRASPPPARLVHFTRPSGLYPASSAVHFVVTPELPEVREFARVSGWLQRGFTVVSVPWLELRWTTDGWKTTNVLSSNDVPCPVVNGYFMLPRVAPGTEVEFAVRVGVACHAPHDTAGERESGEFWMNDGGANYRQVTR